MPSPTPPFYVTHSIKYDSLALTNIVMVIALVGILLSFFFYIF